MGYIATDITEIGDPFVLYENGRYYMYATSSADGFKVWEGSSLGSLRDAGLCYFKEDSFGYECFWAPEVVRRADGKYIMFFTARDRKDGILRTGVALSDSPTGVFKDVNQGKPMFDIGTATIDATCFTDDDGRSYLFFVKDCSTNIINGIHTSQIFAAELSESLTELVGKMTLIAEPSQKWETKSLPAACENLVKGDSGEKFVWNEGPFVIKRGGRYYLNYSANCFDSRNYSVGIAESKSPLGPYVKYDDNPAMEYIENELSGPGHNSLFENDKGELTCAFHCHTYYDSPSGNRRFCYCPVKFEKGKMKLLYK